MNKNMPQGYLLLGLTMLIWGFYMPIGKVIVAQLDVFWLTFLRYFVAGIVLALVVLWREGASVFRLWRPDLVKLFLLGSLGSAGFGLFSYLGVTYTRPEHAAAISVLTPINVAVVRAFQLRRLPPRSVVLCALGVVAGAIMVVTRGDLTTLMSGGSMKGNLLVFIGSMCWTFYTIGAQTMTGFTAIRLTAFACMLGAPVGLAVAVVMTGIGIAHVPSLAAMADLWPQLTYLIFAVSIVSIVTWNAAVKAVGAQDATLISSFSPVIPFTYAFFRGQVFTPVEIAGVVLIVAAIVAHNLNERRRVLMARG